MSSRTMVLSTADAEQWRTVMAGFLDEMHDIYFTPEYHEMHEANGDGEAILFVFVHGANTWAMPAMLRPVTCVGTAQVPFPCADLTSVYGYGGPLSTSAEQGFLLEADHAYTDFCAQRHVVSEFIRLHPLIGNHAYIPFDNRNEVLGIRDYVWVDLIPPVETMWTDSFTGTARTDIRKARKLGFQVAQATDEHAWGSFVNLYLARMRHLGADRFYHFSPAYFSRLLKLVRATGALFVARLGDTVHSAAVFLRYGSYAHYHLAASDGTGKAGSASSLLLYHAIGWARAAGATRLHLGGGMTNAADDSLYRFKTKFSPLRARYHVRKRVLNGGAYDWLTSVWERQHPEKAELQRHILQRYRDS